MMGIVRGKLWDFAISIPLSIVFDLPPRVKDDVDHTVVDKEEPRNMMGFSK